MEVVSFCKNGAKKNKLGMYPYTLVKEEGQQEKICDGQGADSENSYGL